MTFALRILLCITLTAYYCETSPVSTENNIETTTTADDGAVLFGVIEIIDETPQVVLYVDTTTNPPTEGTTHKVAKRSAFRSDSPSNDLLTNLDAFNLEDGLSSLDGRRIKVLPTWVG